MNKKEKGENQEKWKREGDEKRKKMKKGKEVLYVEEGGKVGGRGM